MLDPLYKLWEIFYALAAIGTGSGPEKGTGSSSDEGVTEEDQKQMKRALRAFKLRDKMSFVFGIFNIGLTCYLLGANPLLFYLWHTPKAIVLIGFRFWRYYQVGIHYYLLDFCYYANVLLLVYLWVFPLNERLFKVLFVFCNGPLAWAIVQFRNSLVLHSSDKMTSVFIHLSPPLVMWTLRWYSAPGLYHWPYVEVPIISRVPETFSSLVAPAYLPHCAWAVAYYVWIFIVKGKRIEQKGYTTLFNALMEGKKGPVYKICSSFRNPWMQRGMYLLVHQLFCFLTASLCILFWNNFWVHTAFLFAIIGKSAFNGANFYFEVFAKRYVSELGEKAANKSKAF